MVYRVHYLCGSKERRTDQIEASSPVEAAIKFRHTRRQIGGATFDGVQVLSVSREPEPEELVW